MGRLVDAAVETLLEGEDANVFTWQKLRGEFNIEIVIWRWRIIISIASGPVNGP